jgi:F0F1-type ATP synthase assembly protein I
MEQFMKKIFKTASWVVLPFFLVLTLESKVFKDEPSRVQVDTPAGWEIGGDDTNLEVYSPDKLVSVLFHSSSNESLEGAIHELEEELKKQMTDIQEGKPKKGKHNGMDMVTLAGTGVLEGTKVEWEVTILVAEKPVIVLSILLPGWKKHLGTLNKFAKSIKKY